MFSLNRHLINLIKIKNFKFVFAFLFLFSNTGWASWLTSSDSLTTLPDEHIDETIDVEDPMEDVNRSVFRFNQDVDRYFAKPLTEIYQAILPQPAQESVHNLINNISSPVIFFNDILQLEGDRAMDTLARFLINTTLGLGGIFDPANELFDIHFHEEDFGETLGSYGVEGYPYLVLPLLGPSNLRDLGGMVVDFFLDPFDSIVRKHDLDYLIYLRWALEGIDKRVEADSVLNQIYASYDPYVRMRSIYTQNRAFNISKGTVDNDSPVPSDDDEGITPER